MYEISEQTAREIVKEKASYYAFVINKANNWDATNLCEEGMLRDLSMDFLVNNPDLTELYKAHFSTTMMLLELAIPKKLQKILK